MLNFYQNTACTKQKEYNSINFTGMDNTIFQHTEAYINSLLAPEDEALAGVEQSLIDGNSAMWFGSISPSQGKFLQVLAGACNAKRILELGTLGGYSTIWLARALPHDGKLITIEYDPSHAAISKDNITKAGVANKVEIRIGKAIDILTQMQQAGEAPFDMVFMDADKPPYTEYFQLALKLSRAGTIIVADNVVRGGKVLDTNSEDAAVKGVRRFNEMLSKNTSVTATILQMVGAKDHDGMAIAVVN